MNQMKNAGALVLCGSVMFALAACSVSEAPVAQESSRATPAVEPPVTGHAPKLSVVHSPTAAKVAAVKGISFGSSSPKPGAHVLSGGAGGACGFTSGDATCDACVSGSCCAEDAACAGDADCVALVTCFDSCTDDACFSSCEGAHSTGSTKLGAFIDCVSTSCATDCGGPPPPSSGGSGGACGGVVSSGSPTCDACLDATCCGDVNACVSDADCRDFMSCLDSCSDATCETACQTAHPTGAVELTSLSTCVTTSCSACVASSPPPPSSPPSPPSPSSCGLSSGLATCDACLDASCCAQSSACVGDVECSALITCIGSCSDDACANACAAAHGAGVSKLDAVFSCVTTTCGPSCN